VVEETRSIRSERKRTLAGALPCASGAGSESSEALLESLYGELRGLARRNMAREALGQTLQPTALVHEAYLRLANEGHEHPWANARQFYSAAATAMQRILVERARSKQRLKRGGDRGRVPLCSVEQVESELEKGVDRLADALDALGRIDPRAVEVIQLRYFVGLDLAETAAVMDISPRTVRREWEAARLWLARKLAPLTPAGLRIDHAS
jgi:RNA polymerase sigma factor (TIGR02999 family)